MDNDGWRGFAATINHFRPRIDDVRSKYKSLFTNTHNTAPN